MTMKNERGYTLIEVMASLAIMCIVTAAAGSLLSAGIRYFDRESRRAEGEELVERIGKQLSGMLRYAEDLEISNRWEVREGTTAFIFDTDGCVSTAIFADSGSDSLPEPAEIFGTQYLEERTLRCRAAVNGDAVTVRLTLMSGENVICEREVPVRMLNMELSGRRIKTPKDVIDNEENPVVFYIRLGDRIE